MDLAHDVVRMCIPESTQSFYRPGEILVCVKCRDWAGDPNSDSPYRGALFYSGSCHPDKPTDLWSRFLACAIPIDGQFAFTVTRLY